MNTEQELLDLYRESKAVFESVKPVKGLTNQDYDAIFNIIVIHRDYPAAMSALLHCSTLMNKQLNINKEKLLDIEDVKHKCEDNRETYNTLIGGVNVEYGLPYHTMGGISVSVISRSDSFKLLYYSKGYQHIDGMNTGNIQDTKENIEMIVDLARDELKDNEYIKYIEIILDDIISQSKSKLKPLHRRVYTDDNLKPLLEQMY
jgi:hypothetical protein